MKKAIAFLTLNCVILTLSACSETSPAASDTIMEDLENVSCETTIMCSSQHGTTLPTAHEISLRWHDLPREFEHKWVNTEQIIVDVILERIWANEYEENYGVTYNDVSVQHLAASAALDGISSSELYGDGIRTYAELRNHLSLRDFWTFSNELIWGNDAMPNEGVYVRALMSTFELFQRYSITRDEFVRANNRSIEAGVFWGNYNVRQGLYLPHELSCPRETHFTPEEIDLLFSGDTTAIMRAALNPWSIMVEDRVYSAQWLLDHSPEEWAAEGIPASEVTRAFDVFRVVLDDSQVSTFEDSLDVFRREYSSS
jgi:hypothetical protein